MKQQIKQQIKLGAVLSYLSITLNIIAKGAKVEK
jgi:hypothetical protein